MSGRRAALAAALATVLLPAHGRSQSGDLLVRYDVGSDAGKAMLRVYAKGVALLQARSGRLPLSWVFQWYIHATPHDKDEELKETFGSLHDGSRALANEIWYTCQSHLEDTEEFFLPWHRLYVLYFEEIIRQVTDTPGFTLPYWNYTDPAATAIPEEFRSSHADDPVFGALYRRNRNKDDGVQFADVNAGDPIDRYFGGSASVLNLADMRPSQYGSSTGFNAQLNQNLHGTLHRLVGDSSNMGRVPTAAGDPLFWLHHANIDRIWCGWNYAGRLNPSDAAWLGKRFVFVNGGGSRVEVPVGGIADSFALNYRYDRLPAPPGEIGVVAEARGAATNVLLRSGGAAVARVPILLAPTPLTVILVAVSARSRLGAVSLDRRLVLWLRRIEAPVEPGTLYKIYLDLPDGADLDAAGGHFVGLLNFFNDLPAAGHRDHGARAGRNAAFDITDLVRILRADQRLRSETAVTLVPTGRLSPDALPAIMGGIDVSRMN